MQVIWEHYVISYEKLVYPQILVPTGILNLIPLWYWGMTMVLNEECKLVEISTSIHPSSIQFLDSKVVPKIRTIRREVYILFPQKRD
jgi:hypothetical protein